jgi:hypothetical protein
MIKRSIGEKLHLKKIIESRPGFPESWVESTGFGRVVAPASLF